MKITPFVRRALDVIAKAGTDGTGAGDIGGDLWPERAGRIAASGGGGDYAAQCLLGRLRKAGLVEHAPSEGSSRWRLSALGRRHQEQPS